MNELSDNYSKFLNFCKSQNSREQRLSRALLKEVVPSNNDESIKILDIGSSDGRMIPYLLTEISTKFKGINVDLLALEPDSIPFKKLFEVSLAYGFKTIRTDLETFLTQQPETFDLIIGTHVLYHFENWENSVENIKNLLNRNGQIIFVIDSDESPIYELRESVLEVVGLSQSVQSYGNYRFAKDFRNMLIEKAWQFKEIELTSDLVVKSTSENDRNNDLLEILSFLHRVAT
jgi:SAM-dependent methyltransferase